MAKIESIVGPVGWLIDPQNKWAIHFYSKKLSNGKMSSDFTIDMWCVAPASGNAMKFKSRRKATKQDSLKTCKQLLASNWVEFDFEKNKAA